MTEPSQSETHLISVAEPGENAFTGDPDCAFYTSPGGADHVRAGREAVELTATDHYQRLGG